MMHRFIVVLLMITACVSSPKKQTQMNELAPDAWAELQEQTLESVILDVRTEEEFESGYIKGALNMDIRGGADFLASIESLDKSKSYFVYCRSGARSGQACQLMSQMGFSALYNLCLLYTSPSPRDRG